MNKPSPREELLHNIDPLYPAIGKRMFPDSFDNRIRAAIRVGDMKLLTGSVGKIYRSFYLVKFLSDIRLVSLILFLCGILTLKKSANIFKTMNNIMVMLIAYVLI